MLEARGYIERRVCMLVNEGDTKRCCNCVLEAGGYVGRVSMLAGKGYSKYGVGCIEVCRK